MARTVDDITRWILSCPRVGETQHRLVAFLQEVRGILEPHPLQYTVSMYFRVNAERADAPTERANRLGVRIFRFACSDSGFSIEHGIVGGEIHNTVVPSTEAAKPILRAAVAFVLEDQ